MRRKRKTYVSAFSERQLLQLSQTGTAPDEAVCVAYLKRLH
jgi:hypothetical protein